MIEQLTQNWLCWVIVLLAFFCYQQLLLGLFSFSDKGQTLDPVMVEKTQHQEEFISLLIGALPLIGLFGTIVGLLDCFSGIASEGVNSELVSGGIGNALLTTQLGLVCAIPAWLLHSYVRAYWQRELNSAQNMMEQP